MSTPTQNERVRASKLRRKVADGKELNPADRIWLADYERNHPRKAKAADPARNTPTSGPAAAASSAAPKLAGFVHETQPTTGAVAADATWIPEVPPAPEGETPEPPPQDGTPPPPVAGTPLVDDAQQPAGDPVAAKKFGLFVAFVAGMGLDAANELLEAAELPAHVRAILGSPEMREATLSTVAKSGEACALKWGFGGVPMPDEAVVAVALLGSGALVFKNEKRKKLAAGKQTAAQHDEAQAQAAPPQQAQPDDELSRLLGKARQ